jgi:dsDNA-specific endonuclease/ATPase MutS2
MNDLVRVLRGQRIDGRGADEIMRRAADELDRLRAVVKKANEQAEHFERGWYLRGDELERLERELAEARWLLNHAVTRETVAEWTQRRDAFLAADQPSAVDDLAALVRRLVRALKNTGQYSELQAQAMDYLQRQSLAGSPLREATANKSVDQPTGGE